MEKSKEFLLQLVSFLVDNPQDIQVEGKTDEMGVLLTLHLNPSDMGKVIGKQGNTATHIRSLLRIVGLREGARVNMKIAEPEGSTRQYPTTDEAMESVKDL